MIGLFVTNGIKNRWIVERYFDGNVIHGVLSFCIINTRYLIKMAKNKAKLTYATLKHMILMT